MSLFRAGNICMFFSNKYTADGVKNSVGELDNTFQNLQSYIITIPKVNTLMEEGKVL